MPNSPFFEIAAITGISFSLVYSPVLQVPAVTGFSVSAVGEGDTESPALHYAAVSGFSADVPTPVGTGFHAAATSGFSVGDIVLVGTPSDIRAALKDIISLFGGCCDTPPSECILAEAVRAVNAGLQLFYQSSRARHHLVNQRIQRYRWNAPGEGGHLLASATGIDLPSRAAIDSGVTVTHDLQHVSRVVMDTNWGGAGQTYILRPVSSDPLGSAGNSELFPTNPSGASLADWLEDNTGDTPLFYEVFTDPDNSNRPRIRAFPYYVDGFTNPMVLVSYVSAAAPVTAADYSNGSSFDIGTKYVELYLLPLCRHAALSSSYMDAENAPQVAAVKEAYAATLAFLGLASPEPPAITKE